MIRRCVRETRKHIKSSCVINRTDFCVFDVFVCLDVFIYTNETFIYTRAVFLIDIHMKLIHQPCMSVLAKLSKPTHILWPHVLSAFAVCSYFPRCRDNCTERTGILCFTVMFSCIRYMCFCKRGVRCHDRVLSLADAHRSVYRKWFLMNTWVSVHLNKC